MSDATDYAMSAAPPRAATTYLGESSRSRTLRLAFGVAVVVLALAFPFLVGQNLLWVSLASKIIVFLIVTLGLNLLFGLAGIPFLGQGALIAVSAYTTAILVKEHSWSFWIAMLVSIPLVMLAGMLVALPSIRISAWYFALISLSLNTVVAGLVTQWDFTGGVAGIVGVMPPTVGDHSFSPTDMYLLVLVTCVLAFIVVGNIARSRFGRSVAAQREDGAVAASVGVAPLRLKFVMFLVSAVLCSLAGSYLGPINLGVSASNFSPTFSIFFLVAVVVGGAGTKWGPVLGVLVIFALPEFLDFLASWQLLIYGVLLLVLMVYLPNGIMGVATDLAARRKRVVALRSAAAHSPAHAADVSGRPVIVPDGVRARGDAGDLVVAGVNKAFGGVTVLTDLSLRIPDGSIFGILGPNGSGKTTTLNVICGYYAPDSGTVTLGGQELTGQAPYRIARRGIARTFQTPRILEHLDALDNLIVGASEWERSNALSVVLNLPGARRERRELRTLAHDVLRLLAIDDVAGVDGAHLTHGQRRLVEVGRALMTRPRLLLLDEPAAGLSPLEIEHLAAAIKAVRASGITVALIEHHVDLVVEVADEVVVIDRGRVIGSGAPADVLAMPAVVSAYMGG